MSSLEAKVPPPAVAAVVAVAIWGTSRLAPLLQAPSVLRAVAAAAIALVGVGFSAAGILAFRRARTTVNPTTPEKASSLVNSGVYRITRNPMYVGLSCVLVAWAVFLSSAWALLGPVAFMLYIGRFQIAPEERALTKLFGSAYASYQARVRRWL
jgi:protein-S-isoprenylcysteine O-methyltransferase Ste14